MKNVIVATAVYLALFTTSNAAYAKVTVDATLYNDNGTAIGSIDASTEVAVTGDTSLGGVEIIWAGARAYTDKEVLKNVPSIRGTLGACKIKSGTRITEGAGSGATVIKVDADSWAVVNELTGNYCKVTMGAYSGYVAKDKVVFEDLPTSTAMDRMVAATKRVQIVSEAKKCLGVKYTYGGSSMSGFDCSGLTQYVYKQAGVSIPRVAEDQCAQTTPVDVTELLPGDIVFFTKNGRVHHTGIYVGDGQMIHAPYTGTVVKYTTIIKDYYRDCFYRGGRVIF